MQTLARHTSRTMWLLFPLLAVTLTGCFQEAGNSIQPTPVSLTSIPNFQTNNGLETPTPFVTPLPAGGFVAPSDDPNSFLTPTALENDPLNNNSAVNSPIIVTNTPDIFVPSPIPAQPSPTVAPVQAQPSPTTMLATPTALPGDLPCKHTVQPGEWFYSIARTFNVSPADLLAVNPRANPDALQPGDVLNLPNCDPNAQPQANNNAPQGVAPTATPPSLLPVPTALGPATNIPTPIPLSGRNYTVVDGDTLGSIARKFGTTVQALKQANNMTNDFLSIGMVLKIPASQ
jgi:membrane-bound lytic murein transglycosylase D